MDWPKLESLGSARLTVVYLPHADKHVPECDYSHLKRTGLVTLIDTAQAISESQTDGSGRTLQTVDRR